MGRRRAWRGGVCVVALLAALGLGGCTTTVSPNVNTAAPGYDSDANSIQVVSALVGGKNVYIPSTIVLTAGAGRSLSLFNTTEMPHGFSIPALGVEVVLPPGEEVQLPLPPLAGGHVYAIHCQLHPAHRTAVLVVLPAR